MEAKGGCVVCKNKGISRGVRRKVMRELSTNIPPNITGSGCRKCDDRGVRPVRPVGE